MRLNWVTAIAGPSFLARAKDVAGGVNWTALRPELEARGLLSQPGLVVAVTRWNDAGKIDYALDGRLPVVVLAADAREYGIVEPADRFIGHPMLILVPDSNPARRWRTACGPMFDEIAILQSIQLRFGGYRLLNIAVLKGIRIQRSVCGQAH